MGGEVLGHLVGVGQGLGWYGCNLYNVYKKTHKLGELFVRITHSSELV